MKTPPFNVAYFSGGKESHSYTETWEKTSHFCPNCGSKSVWESLGCGDYYVGSEFLCSSCSHRFYLPDGVADASNNEQGKQRLAAIKALT